MTPGAYLCLRRQAAGLTYRQVGKIVALTPAFASHADLVVRELEQGLYLPDDALLTRLRLAFSFDRFIVHQLGGEWLGVPPPDLCRVCACSWADPCVDEHGPCAWADSGADEHGHRLCTRHQARETAHAA